MNEAIILREVGNSAFEEITPFLLASAELGIEAFAKPFELAAGLRTNKA